MNILIFGAGIWGKRYYDNITNKNSHIVVLAFIDNDLKIVGTNIGSIPIISPEEIRKYNFDKIVIATKTKFANEISNQLFNMGFSECKIERPSLHSDLFNVSEKNDRRVNWLRDFSNYTQNNISGSVAECGVYRGHFAYFINKYFSDRKLYLFDTFEGFVSEDVNFELSLGNSNFNNSVFAKDKNIFKDNDVELVKQFMPHPERCVFKKGIFPETTVGVEDSFSFVNLDMDLYKPMLAALEFFWNRMERGGAILLHDYFSISLPGVKKAVDCFEKRIHRNICKTPIGDFCSIALIKD